MRVRPATLADIAAMQALATCAVTAAQWTQLDYESVFRHAGNVTRHTLILEEEGRVQAFIIAREARNEWEIENIAVAGALRRRGLGTRLLGEMLDLARSRGAREVFLEVRESNSAARKLYAKWGFVESGRRKDYYNSPVEDACIYKFVFI